MKLPSPHNSLRALITLFIVVTTSFEWRFFPRRQPQPCSAWLHWLIALDNPLAHAHKAQNIIKNAGIETGMSVLDMGCGPGRVAIPAAIKVGPSSIVSAIDLQDEMLENARKKSHQCGLNNIVFFKTRLLDYIPPENSFDRILLISVIGEIPESERGLILEKAHHGLKTDGKLSITESIFDPDCLSEKDICNLATNACFKAESKFGNWISFTLNFKKMNVQDLPPETVDHNPKNKLIL